MEETAVLIERSQAGDKEAREVLIEENLGLVRHIVKRFIGRGYDAEDLFQIGCIGLIKAIDKFDLQFGVRFSTYAVPMIQGEIKRFLRDDGMVKVSRTLKENGWKIKQAAEKLSQIYGREATLQEISAQTELTIEEIVMALDANVEVESIYKSVYQSDGNEIYLVDQVVENGAGCTAGVNRAGEDTEKEEKEPEPVKLKIRKRPELLNETTPLWARLIGMRYFQDKTQMEVAKCLGISQVQVSRMEKRILLRLRREVG